MAPPDPTNAYAVPGPSRLPSSQPQHPRASTGAAFAAAGAAPRPSANDGSRTSSRSSSQRPARKEPIRRADGPLLVKTVVAADGVREVPGAFEHCEVEDLINLISAMLDRLIEHNDRIPLTSTSLTRFHSRAPPNISVRDYLLRIAKFTNVEACCLLILLPYVDKVCARLSSFTISSLTVHRFLIAAVSVGSKALSDAFCTNGRYARVGGVSVVEMNLLEKEFCEALDWRLTTSGPVLAHYYTSLVRSHPGYRLSDAPLPSPPPPPHIDIPAPTSPLAPQSPLTPSGQPHSLFGAMAMDVEQPPSAAPAALAPVSTNGPVDRPSPSSPPSPTAPPSSSSSNVSLSSNSAFSASNPHSLSGSPQRDRHRGRERADPTSDQSGSGGFSPSLAVGPSPFAPPPLIPPKLHSASASHLPSPIRAPGMGSAGAARRSSATSPPLARVAAAAEVPPASPAKRARGPSTSGQGGQAGPGAATANESYRFAPSPRLSNGADTAGGSAAAVAATMNEGY